MLKEYIKCIAKKWPKLAGGSAVAVSKSDELDLFIRENNSVICSLLSHGLDVSMVLYTQSADHSKKSCTLFDVGNKDADTHNKIVLLQGADGQFSLLYPDVKEERRMREKQEEKTRSAEKEKKKRVEEEEKSRLTEKSKKEERVLCGICNKALGVVEFYQLSCGHSCHKECLKVKFLSLPETTLTSNTTCFVPKCSHPIYATVLIKDGVITASELAADTCKKCKLKIMSKKEMVTLKPCEDKFHSECIKSAVPLTRCPCCLKNVKPIESSPYSFKIPKK